MMVTDAKQSAQRLVALLSNEERGLARETLLINAAVAAWAQGSAANLIEGKARATEALDSRRALDVLGAWQKFSREN